MFGLVVQPARPSDSRAKREPVSSYSLAGIQAATAEPQQHVTMRAIEVLAGDDRILTPGALTHNGPYT